MFENHRHTTISHNIAICALLAAAARADTENHLRKVKKVNFLIVSAAGFYVTGRALNKVR